MSRLTTGVRKEAHGPHHSTEPQWSAFQIFPVYLQIKQLLHFSMGYCFLLIVECMYEWHNIPWFVMKLYSINLLYRGIIIVHGGPMFVDFMGHILIPNNLRPHKHAFIFSITLIDIIPTVLFISYPTNHAVKFWLTTNFDPHESKWFHSISGSCQARRHTIFKKIIYSSSPNMAYPTPWL
jgi:hypothetical protein